MVTKIAAFKKQFEGEIMSFTSMNKVSSPEKSKVNKHSLIEQLFDKDKVAYKLIKQAEQKIHEREQ